MRPRVYSNLVTGIVGNRLTLTQRAGSVGGHMSGLGEALASSQSLAPSQNKGEGNPSSSCCMTLLVTAFMPRLPWDPVTCWALGQQSPQWPIYSFCLLAASSQQGRQIHKLGRVTTWMGISSPSGGWEGAADLPGVKDLYTIFWPLKITDF